MKRMKRLTCALVAISVLVIHSNPASAKFAGTLRSDVPWTLVISSEVSGLMFATTVTFVDSRGRQDVDVFTTQQGEDLQAYGGNIPRGTRRIIIELDISSDDPKTVRVHNGANTITINSTNDSTRIVLDVV